MAEHDQQSTRVTFSPPLSSRNIIELSAKYFDPQRKLRKQYLLNTILEQRSSGPGRLYLLVDLTELELEFGKQEASQVTRTEDFSYHSTLTFLRDFRWKFHYHTFLVKQSQADCSVSERTIRSCCEAFCYFREVFLRDKSVDLSNCTLPTQVALLHTLLTQFDIAFSKRSYSTKLFCIFSNDFFYLKENEFMYIINITKPMVVQGEISKKQFQELIFYSFLLLTEYNEKIARAMIDAGADIDMSDKDGKTALFYATDRDNENIAHALIEAGADVNIKDKEGNTVLLCVFGRRYNNRMCKILLEAGSSLCETTRKQETVFHLALNICQQNILRSPYTDKRQKPLLWHTILHSLQLFSELSESKVAVNKRDMYLNSPLHLWASLVLASPHQYREDKYSFERMLKECLELIVKCGIKLNYRNKQEQTPLHMCRTWTAVKLLLDAGAKPDVTDSSGCTPLLAAAKRNTCIEKDSELFYPDVTQTPKEFWKEVIDKKLDPWCTDKDGNSVLSILIQKEANYLAKALVEAACELKYVQSDGIGLPLLSTICSDNSVDKVWKVDLVKILLKYRSDLAQERVRGEDTALHFCCRNMMLLPEGSIKTSVHCKIAQHLILCGADVQTPGKEGQSCLDMAEHCPVLKQLLTLPFNPDEMPPLIDSWKTVSEKHQDQLTKISRGFNCQQIETVYYFKETLDHGTFGLMFVGINIKDGKEVAVKRVEKLRVDKESTLREIEGLRRDINCNNIIQCLLCTCDKDFLYVILELMEGNLDDLLSDVNCSRISQETKLCRDICTGLDYLHNHEIFHKGIKPSNILYQVLPSGINLKLAFFGLRSQMSKEQHVSDYTDTYEGLIKERCWMAPEVLQSQSHSKSSDVFSCGLVIHYLLSNKKHPFGDPGSSKESLLAVSIETVDNIAQDKMELDEAIPSDVKGLLEQMLDHSPTSRVSISNALEHSFFQCKS